MGKLLDTNTIESMMEQAIDIIEKIGVKFEHERALSLFEKAGAKLDGKTVFISRDLLEDCLNQMPKNVYTPGPAQVIGGAMFGNVPVIYDDEKKIFRQVTIDDTIKVYKLVETSELYGSSNPSTVDPVGLSGEDRYVTQLAFYLKYSNKYLANGMRSISQNAKDQNVYESARNGFRLVKNFYGVENEAVVDQTICPMPPLGYDRESLDNLFATVDEQQNLGICPCSLSCLTGPAGLYELVVHDIAMALAGVVLVQLASPGMVVSLSNSSGATDMRTMQPTYGSVEATLIQCMFFEFCVYYNISASFCGTLCDAPFPNYQAGAETFLSTFLPFYYTNADCVYCYPGDMAGWRCGSFEKAILDEELMRNINRTFKPLYTEPGIKFMETLSKAKSAGTFLTGRTPKEYRRDQYLTQTFSKYGIPKEDSLDKVDLHMIAQAEIDRRLSMYELPERTLEQKKLLNRYLPREYQY